jgi:uncharacterized delta-60 repeat protein
MNLDEQMRNLKARKIIILTHMKKITTFLLALVTVTITLAQPGSIDPTFNPGTGFNGTVNSIAIQSDGKIMVGGGFTSFNGTTINGIARLNADGSLDASFNPGTGFVGTVYSTAIQSDGKIIVGGTFTSFNGTTRNRIARLNSDGSLDTSFDPYTVFSSSVITLAIQSDGKIIAGGEFFNGSNRNFIARLNADGSPDDSFNIGSGFDYIVYSSAIQSDGKIIVGGIFSSFNGTASNKIARLNIDGSLDASFNIGTGFNTWIGLKGIAIQGNGKIILGGNFTSFNGTAINYIARLNADGTLDASFNIGTGFNGTVNSTAIQPDGKILVGGGFTSFNSVGINRFARLNADGSLDASFNIGTGFDGSVRSTAIQSDGKIIAGGEFAFFDGIGRNRIARLLSCTTPASPTASGVTICTGNSATLTATAPGGTYQWYTTSSGGTVLSTGATFITSFLTTTTTYYVQTTIDGCTSEKTAVTVTVNPDPAAPFAISNSPICEGQNIELTASTITGATYAWTGPNGFTSTLQNPTITSANNAATGTYSVTAKVNGCTSAASTTLVEVTSSDGPLFSYSSSTFCQTGPNPIPTITNGYSGTFTASPSLVFGNNSTGEINLSASSIGIYTITFTASSPCPVTYSVQLIITDAPSAIFSFDPNTVCQSNPNILPTFPAGASSGVFSSTAGLDFVNTNSGEINLQASIPGTYSVTNFIAASGGCAQASHTSTITIDPAATANAGTDLTICEGESAMLNGLVGGSATSGTWSGGTGTFSPSANFLNANYTPSAAEITAGFVVLTLTTNDPSGNCNAASDNIFINITPAPAAPTAGSNGPICEGQNIELTASTITGATYFWTGPNGFTSTLQNPTIPAATVAASGIYQVTALVPGCSSSSADVAVIVNPYLEAPIASSNAPLCLGSTLKLSASTITGATYKWFGPNGFSSTLQNPSIVNTTSAANGTYYVIAKISGCNSDTANTVVQLNAKPSSPVVYNNGPVCDRDTLKLTAGNVANAIYNWSGPNGFTSDQQNPAIANITLADSGKYILKVTVDGCSSNASITTVSVKTLPFVTVVNDTICRGQSATLSSVVSPTGGTYLWSNAANAASITVSPVVTTAYTLTYKAPNGCSNTVIGNAVLYQETDHYITKTNASCRTCNDGAVKVLVSGGAAPYSYLWSNGNTTPNISNLAVGTYTLTVTDSRGCAKSSSITITSSCNLNISAAVVNTACENTCTGAAVLSVSGGNAPYAYFWDNGRYGEIETNLCAGTYTVSVVDAIGCTAMETITITEPQGLSVNLVTTTSDCKKRSGSATATVSGGTAPYQYQWTNGSRTNKADSLLAGSYMVTVTDNNGCSMSALAVISDNNAPSITSSSIVNNLCYGQSKGAINITVSGGAGAYQYFWSNGETTANISGLQTGPYEVRVIGGDSCVAMSSFVVSSPSKIEIAETITKANCGVANGAASVAVSGGSGTYAYAWSSGAVTSGINAVPAGVYQLTVKDNNNCQRVKSVAIGEQGGPQITVTSVIMATCNETNGSAFIEVSGGTPGYSYTWSNGSSSDRLQQVKAGIYHLLVKDQGGCRDFAAIEVPAGIQSLVNACILATVDTISGKNQIIWEKDESINIDYYNIYRESSASNVYMKAGSVKADSLTIFTDHVADPKMRSWRYKIGAVDNCGIESEYTLRQKTIHLMVIKGLNQSHHLSWDQYEGFDYSTFYIYRIVANKEYLIDSVPGTTTSYTDSTAPAGAVFYQIEVKHPEGCETIRAVNHNSARSNKSTAAAPGGDDDEDISVIEKNSGISSLRVYPNPVKNNLYISARIEQNLNSQIYLMDMHGRIFFHQEIKSESGVISTSYDTTTLAPGVYFVRLVTDKGVLNRKVVVSH